MRTTLDLPEALLTEAMALTHHKTKTSVIVSALEVYVRQAKLNELRKFKGKLHLDLDLDASRKRG